MESNAELNGKHRKQQEKEYDLQQPGSLWLCGMLSNHLADE